jgi:putative tricarboxylic transport membrane protein
MDLFGELFLGFQVALSPSNLLFCFVGVMVGTLIGVLPGIGPLAALAMLLPATFYLPPTGALIMLAGIYYGAQYGGSTTAILVNLPGESSSIVTCIDGYQMALRGRAGAALAIAGLGSFFAGTICTLLIAIAAPPLSEVALSFGAAEYFALMVLGLTGAVVLARGSMTKAVGMVLLGLALGLVGTDVNSGTLRYTFGLTVLSDGIGFVPIALGMLGVAEIISNLEATFGKSRPMAKIGKLWPTFQEFMQAWPASLRGTAIGAALGVLPGGGALLAAFASYTVEKKIARDPSRFGKGAVEGLAGPESANNAGAQTSFIPMLTLGIPSNAVMALMVGAMTIQGIAPGPRVMTNQPELFWGIIASMWIGNAMLLVINLPLIGIWVQLLKVPYRMLFPCIVLICAIGGFSINNSTYEVGMVAVFGFFGYFMRKVGCEPAPLALGFILGPLMEENLRRAMLLSRGDPTVFITRPISGTLLAVTALLVLLMVLPNFRKTREVAFQEDT